MTWPFGKIHTSVFWTKPDFNDNSMTRESVLPKKNRTGLWSLRWTQRRNRFQTTHWASYTTVYLVFINAPNINVGFIHYLFLFVWYVRYFSLRYLYSKQLRSIYMPSFSRFTWLYLIAAFLSFLVSVSMWFFFEDSEHSAIFVGLWVPSILSLGGILEGRTRWVQQQP